MSVMSRRPFVSGYNDDRVAYLNGILTTGNADAAVAVQASHQKVLPEIQFCKRNVRYGRFLADGKFQCFCIVVQNVIKRFPHLLPILFWVARTYCRM